MYRKNLSGQTTFCSFIPTPLAEIQVIHTARMDNLIMEVEKAIRDWDTRSASLSDQQIQQLVRQEAEYSCRLASDKVSSPFAVMMGAEPETDEDTENLIQAISYAFVATEELPLSTRLLKNCHYLMCKSERYDKKYPGELRHSPVWIGKRGCTLNQALFVPPVYEDMNDALSELEHYMNNENPEHVLIRAALIHYQFETIHPFIDANGRTGRLLNLLYLLENGVIHQPTLKWSEFLWRYRDRYYMELQHVHETGVYENWILFFLTSLKGAAQEGII